MWTAVHDEVQQRLAAMEAEVRRKLPDVHVTAGRTQGRGFFLFSYRTFSAPDSAIDPVVVGVTFTSSSSGVLVQADASGEATGDVIAAAPDYEVAASRNELIAAGGEAVDSLFAAGDRIAAALQDRSRAAG